jgi:hypothetical protein
MTDNKQFSNNRREETTDAAEIQQKSLYIGPECPGNRVLKMPGTSAWNDLTIKRNRNGSQKKWVRKKAILKAAEARLEAQLWIQLFPALANLLSSR